MQCMCVTHKYKNAMESPIACMAAVIIRSDRCLLYTQILYSLAANSHLKNFNCCVNVIAYKPDTVGLVLIAIIIIIIVADDEFFLPMSFAKQK